MTIETLIDPHAVGCVQHDCAKCAEQETTIATLRAQVAEVRKDAARLDWLQNNAKCDPKMDGNHQWWPLTWNQVRRCVGPTIRAAVDAAMPTGSETPIIAALEAAEKGGSVSLDRYKKFAGDDAYEAMREALMAMVHDVNYGFYVRQWADYHVDAKTYRLKCLHDIRLADGSEHEGYYPNGLSWSKWKFGNGPARLNDSEVTHIRISEFQMGDELPAGTRPTND